MRLGLRGYCDQIATTERSVKILLVIGEKYMEVMGAEAVFVPRHEESESKRNKMVCEF